MSSERAPLRLVPRDRPDDVELIEATKAGASWAPTALYQRHGPAVRRLFVRALGFHPDVDDLLQDTFAIAFENLATLREADRVGAWLLGIAVQRLRKHLRRKARWAWIRPAVDELPDVAAPIADASTREAMRATYAVLASLGVEERLAFTLRHLEGQKLEEAATAMGVSLATCKRRLQRAEAAFRARAARHDGLEGWLRAGGAHVDE
jgi:RNA polymerase sigma-70 factor (ECF subfamily)